MEVVLLASALSKAATYAIDLYITRSASKAAEKAETVTTRGTHSMSNEMAPEQESVGGSVKESDDDAAGKPSVPTSDLSAYDENSVPALEARLKELRAEAAQLTSADTFVQYAQVTRQANKVEKKLRELKGTCAAHARKQMEISLLHLTRTRCFDDACEGMTDLLCVHVFIGYFGLFDDLLALSRTFAFTLRRKR